MTIEQRFNLSGRKALVTGASRGIGRAVALGLAEAGADVAVHYAGREDAAREVASRIAAMGRHAAVVQGDLGDEEAPRAVAEAALAALGQVDILVLNAAVQERRAWQEVSREEFQQQMTVNVRAPLELMQRLVPAMSERGWGRVVSVGSVQERKPHPQMPVYAAGKAAMENMVRNLAPQLGPTGVTINNLSPGVIATDRNAAVLGQGDVHARILKQIDVGFIGEPDDCVGAALLLCSDAGRYITGTTLLVDGGWSL